MEFQFRYEPNKTGVGRMLGKFLVLSHSENVAEIIAGRSAVHKGIRILDDAARKTLIGAGDFNKNAVVTNWESSGYRITTPMNLRKPIQDAFLRISNKALIAADTW
ncbi:MAG: hypothetical protein AAB573_02590 [Patescibacteria group bacterium]